VSSALVEMIESRPGFEVGGCAASGPALLELLAARPFDLLLLDQNLAGLWPYGEMPGETLLEYVRATYPALAIVVLAMRDDPLDKARSLAAGASAFLPKERIGDVLEHSLAAQTHPERTHPEGCRGR
jgi:DNA-binding NarL/FixJ family response regulator